GWNARSSITGRASSAWSRRTSACRSWPNSPPPPLACPAGTGCATAVAAAGKRCSSAWTARSGPSPPAWTCPRDPDPRLRDQGVRLAEFGFADGLEVRDAGGVRDGAVEADAPPAAVELEGGEHVVEPGTAGDPPPQPRLGRPGQPGEPDAGHAAGPRGGQLVPAPEAL